MRYLAILVAFGLAPIALAQSTLIVPTQYPTIQDAVNAAALSGDTIIVQPGTYFENVDVGGKDIVIRSLIGAPFTTIDGGAVAPTITYPTGSTRASVLTGFTITNGWNAGGPPAGMGGGIKLVGASPTIRDCVISGNRTNAYGGGIGGTDYSAGVTCSPLIESCLIEDNAANGTSYASGGGICITGLSGTAVAGTPEIRKCTIRRNAANTRGGGLYFGYNSGAIVEDNRIYANTTGGTSGNLDGGAGIFVALNALATVVNNRIWGNVSSSNGGGIKYFNVSGLQIINNTIVDNVGGSIAGFVNTGAFGTNVYADVVNCILWNNGAGPEFAFTGTDTNGRPPYVNVSYSDVSGGAPGTGNISASPLLLNVASGNHRLAAGSPCIDVGDGTYPGVPAADFEGDVRPMGAGVDMGADEFNPTAAFLYADVGAISAASPVNITYSVAGGPSRAGYAYVVLFSLSGTDPGLDYLGMHLPLNIDGLTTAVSFVAGGLDGAGNGAALLPLAPGPLPPSIVGIRLSSAAVLVNGLGLISDFTNDENVEFGL